MRVAIVLEKRRLQGVQRFCFLVSGTYKKDRERLFAKAFSDISWGNCFKLRVQLGLSIQKKFFAMSIVKSRNRLPKCECLLTGNVYVRKDNKQLDLVRSPFPHHRDEPCNLNRVCEIT